MNTFISILSKPKVVLPSIALLALIVGIWGFHSVGRAPEVNLPVAATTAATTTAITSNGLDLAFQVGGRVSKVNVKVGDKVYAGQVLVALDSSAALGALNQAKGALDLARSQYSSQNAQYSNTKKQQDVLVANAYRTLLSSSLQATPIGVVDEGHNPVITGTYTCGKEGSYEIDPYPSGTVSGFSFNYTGLEQGNDEVTYNTPQPLGTCGLFVTFASGFSSASKWVVAIPNTKASAYQTNKNAYDLAVATRAQVLDQILANTNSAGITAAEGAYQSALANYNNFVIKAPTAGVVTSIDPSLKPGQLITPSKVVISLTTK